MRQPKLYLTVTLVLFHLFFSGFSALSQQVQITGKVVSLSTNQPVAGASIMTTGSKGSTTNADGQFSVAANKGDRVTASFVGFNDTTFIIGDASRYTVFLATASKQMDEVVVTALGIKKEKKLISYAVQEIKGNELTKAREPNPINSLVGKIAGLTVGSSAELLGRPQLLMRGGNVSLFVVDGIPINSDTWNISPDDIETYTVLKGPVAAVLYGYRGQNGAIVITTKKGTKDKRNFSLEFNSSTMMEKGFVAIPKVQDEYGPGDHGKYIFVDGKGGGLNDGDYDVWGPKFEGQSIPQYDSPVDPVTGKRTGTPWTNRGKDNLKRFIQTGILSTNSIAVAATGEKYDIRFSMSNSYQRGNIPNTQLNISNFNINSGYKFSNKIRLDAQLNYNRQFTDNINDVNYGPNSLIYNIVIWGGADWNVDDMRNYWQPGKEGVQSIYAEYQRYHNPYFVVNEWLRGHYKTDVYGYAALTYDISDRFQMIARSAVTTYDLLRSEKMPFSAHPYGREEGRGDYREDRRSLFENNTELMLKYNNKWKALNFSGFVGGNMRNLMYNSSFVTTDYLNVPNVYNFSNSRNPVKAFNFGSDMRVMSAYYSFDLGISKFLNLNATGRVDKLSTLPNQNNSYFYPSFSANTVLSDYLNLPAALSFAKLRVSYANVKSGGGSTSSTIGATPGASFPLGYGSQYQSSYEGPSYTYADVYSTGQFYNNQTAAYYTNSLIDKNLAPDSRSNIEAGLDLKFLQNRIGLDLTYFNYIDGPQIYNRQLSQATGYNSLTVNALKYQKQGLEISVNGAALRSAKGLNWDVLFNWSTYQEKIKELPEAVSVVNSFFKVGDRTDTYYASAFARTPEGQIINDNGGRPIILPINQKLGYGNPDWVWGLTNRFSYKRFALVFQFDGRVGGTMENYIRRQTFRGGRHIETVQGTMGAARYQDYLGVKSWVGEGVVVSNNTPIQYDAVTGQITNYKELQFSGNNTKTYLQDYISRVNSTAEGNLMSKTYIKLRELTLTHQLAVNKSGRSFIQNATVSLVGRNLLYFVKDKRNKDVDIDQFAGGQTSSDLQSPTTRRYGVNLNLTF